MAHHALSLETAALIADTEDFVTKEFSSISLVLTVARVKDQAGQPVLRRFTCSCDFRGQTISSTAGNKWAAEKGLRKHLNFLGYEPVWTACQDLTVLDDTDDEPEVPTVEPVFVSAREVPGLEPGTLQTPAEEPETPADEPLLVSVPPKTDRGWLTPASDPARWLEVYIAAWMLVLRCSPYELNLRSRKPEELSNIRAEISSVMVSGAAGATVGSHCPAVAPWAMGPDKPWIRMISKCPDPTTKGFKAGMGDGREAHYKTLSGLPAFPEKYEAHQTAREWRLQRAANRFSNAPGPGNGKTSFAVRAHEEACKLAHTSATASEHAALEAGHSEEIAKIHYKWIYCAVMRSRNQPPHTAYEAILAEHGITTEQVKELAKQY